MPTDSDPQIPGESQNPLQGLLAKCGIVIPLSVRGRRASNKESKKPVMSPANSKYKKRKRSSRSPATSSRTPIRMSNQQNTIENTTEKPKLGSNDFDVENADSQLVFDHFLLRDQELDAYVRYRDELKDEEDRDAWDYPARRKASPGERKAAIIIRELREYEREFVFGNNASEAIPGPHTRDMGGQFLTNKDRIEQKSILFEIAKEVPKGAILHLHLNAELHPERLLQEARDMENMYVWSIRPLITKEDLDRTEMIFNILPVDTKSSNIFSQDYKGRDNNWRDGKYPNLKDPVWMKWTDFRGRFREQFPGTYNMTEPEANASGNRTCSEPAVVLLEPAENWIKQKMVLSEDEAYGSTQTVNGVWARFNQATRCFKGLLNYKKVYEWYIGKAIDRMIDEKVMYAELRPMLMDKWIPDNDGKGEIDNFQQMQIVLDSVENKRKELEEDGRHDLFPFGLKIIYCTPRSIPKAKMQSEMKDCIALKQRFPDLICGFDLVGAEDRPNHIGFYEKELVAFQRTCKEKNLDIPFLFHAGETLLDMGGSTDPGKSNLFDAVALNSKRIGHGFALMKHPHLIEKFKRSETVTNGKVHVSPGICIELCPISNELLHLCRNIKEHPYPELLAAKIPCCVNSDNPSLFSNSMSHEFYQIMVGSPTISVHSWRQLAEWSLEYSCLNAIQKERGLRIFRKAWELFCDSIVNDYGKLLTDDKINKEEAKRFYEIETS